MHFQATLLTLAFLAVGAVLAADQPLNVGGYLTKAQESLDQEWVHCAKPTDGDNIYKYSIEHLNASLGTIDLAKFKGKPLLIVNVATFCHSTLEYPMYNKLVEKFGDKLGLVAFPSNNFANQEPTDNPTELYHAIKYVRPGNGFVPKFPLTKRIDVNGEKEHTIYSFLKRSCISTRTTFNPEAYLLYSPKNARDIRWNFEKFLINHEGHVWKRYDQLFTADKITDDIEHLIAEAHKTHSS